MKDIILEGDKVSFIQDLNSKINEHYKMFVTEMKEMFIKNNIKSRIITEFNKADLDIKLIDDGLFEEKTGLDNYKTGDYLNFTFIDNRVKISLGQVYNLETGNICDLSFKIGLGVTEGNTNPYSNNDYKEYLIKEESKYPHGLLKVKNNAEYKKLVDTFYNTVDRVLGGHDGLL